MARPSPMALLEKTGSGISVMGRTVPESGARRTRSVAAADGAGAAASGALAGAAAVTTPRSFSPSWRIPTK